MLMAQRIATRICFLFFLQTAAAQQGIHWPQFRGPDSSGVQEGFSTPVRWNAEEGENTAWKTPLPGLSHSSPVIWSDRVYVTTAVSSQGNVDLKVGLYGDIGASPDESVHQWKVYCLDKNTGRMLWERTAHEGVPRIKRHTKATHANSSPAVDGRHVVVFFGSEGLYSYDIEGNLKWKKDLGVLDSGFFRVPTAQWGFASSPVIHKGLVYIQCDVQKDSFLAVFDVETGEEIWRVARNDVPTWSTPALIGRDHGTDLIVNGWKHIGGYDAATGKELWRMTGGGDIPIPTPVTGHGLIFITNAHGGMAPVYAIRPGARGDISLSDGETTNTHIAWSIGRGGTYMQTPLVYGDYRYICRGNGVLTVHDAKTGNVVHGPHRVGGDAYTASAVGADGKIYYTSESGDVTVLRHGDSFEKLAENPLGEVTLASPALSEGRIYFRTKGHLVAVGE